MPPSLKKVAAHWSRSQHIGTRGQTARSSAATGLLLAASFASWELKALSCKPSTDLLCKVLCDIGLTAMTRAAALQNEHCNIPAGLRARHSPPKPSGLLHGGAEAVQAFPFLPVTQLVFPPLLATVLFPQPRTTACSQMAVKQNRGPHPLPFPTPAHPFATVW